MGHGSEKKGTKIGMIGLDTSHCVAFTKALNNPDAGAEFSGYSVVAAYPNGSRDISSSVERIPGYTGEVEKLGVKIVRSVAELIAEADVVMLETNDGRMHLEQAIPVIVAGKPLFIDKPMTASLSDAIVIFETAKRHKVPVFSCSSLRYITGMEEVISGKIGQVTGADTYSPAKLEKTHPDLFWYGIHGVETLFTAMGTGCKRVVRVSDEDTDLVVGTWDDGRIGTFRGIRKGKADYGGTIFGEKGICVLGKYAGYTPLLVQIIDFFRTGVIPVREEETLQILAFMEAADLSKVSGGVPVEMELVMKKAVEEASKMNI
jgi:predicted dehydrogenase